MFLQLRSLSQSETAPAVFIALAAFACGAFGAMMTIQSTARTEAAPAAQASAAGAPVMAGASYRAEVIRVFDGDTFEARVQVWPGIELTTKVRLRGIDAPELRARCAEERALAETARDALSALLAQGHVGIRQVSLDKYGGRVVADASARGTEDIAKALMARGHVRAYQGGRREDWCARRSWQLAR